MATLVERAVAVRGHELVLPIASGPGADPAGRPVDVRVGENAVRATRHRFSVSTAGPSEWLTSARTWTPWREDDGASDGSPTVDVLVIPSAADTSGDLLLDDERIELDWRPDVRLDVESLFALTVVPAELRTPQGQSSLFQTVAPALDDPSERWRVRLLAHRLRVSGFDILADRLRASSHAHPALESLALQNERRWTIGLSRLLGADPLLARDVAGALTRIATINGVVRPSWTPAIVVGPAGGVDQLLSDLLNLELSVATMLARVDAWLDSQPRAVAWVLDDAGAASPGAGLALARLGIVDLAGRGGIARAEFSPDRPGPGVTIAPLGGATIVASQPMPVRSGTARVVLGEWSAERSVAAGALPVRPPGLRLAPILAPWNLATWLTETPRPPDPDHAAIGVLTRRPDGAWEIRLECRFPQSGIPSGDVIRLCFGSVRQPRAMFQIDPRGFIIDELEPVKEDESPTRTPLAVRVLEDRWSCVIAVPDNAVESGSLLRLGMERRNERGERWTWPRPVLPEQDQPGRALIDLDAWFGFRSAP